jgi:protein-S-isoprenylcysteine O-methyltransferase Ste14
MGLVDELEKQGGWLFRWRSFLPISLILFVPIALYGFHLPFDSLPVHEYWAKFCVAVSLVGLALRCFTVGCTPESTSGRNTRRQVAQQLNTTGIYSIVRHPLYLGNYIIGLGITLTSCAWWLPVIYSLLFWLYYERIMFVEEAFLSRKFGDAFGQWSAQTPAFIPKLRLWKPPALAFSFRNVLKREYSGLMIVVLGHGTAEFTKRYMIQHRVVYETFWVTLIFGGTAAYFLLRMLKVRTRCLEVPGR